MLRSSEYNANRFRKGGMEDIFGFGTPVSQPTQASPQRAGTNPITHEVHQDPAQSATAALMGSARAGPARSFPGVETPDAADSWPSAATNEGEGLQPPVFGTRKGRGMYGTRGDSGADVFGRTLHSTSLEEAPTAAGWDKYGAGVAVSSDDTPISRAARDTEDAQHTDAGFGVSQGMELGVLHQDLASEAESFASGSFAGGLSSEQSNRTKFGKRRFPENDHVSRIF